MDPLDKHSPDYDPDLVASHGDYLRKRDRENQERKSERVVGRWRFVWRPDAGIFSIFHAKRGGVALFRFQRPFQFETHRRILRRMRTK